ncbi:hypothetical protein [Mycobacterium leprae]|uniref:hypothetical protein n=1 Tax=Mycobacterium leprae TaxID=1769 RepID=UPI0027BAD934|nr:hypothetical protein [Mycobacterium leprae]
MCWAGNKDALTADPAARANLDCLDRSRRLHMHTPRSLTPGQGVGMISDDA